MKNLLLPLGNGDVITYELRVTSYELRFYKLLFTSCKSRLYFILRRSSTRQIYQGYSQGKTSVKWNSSAYKKCKYGHLGCWYNKSTLYKRFLNWNKIKKKNKEVTGKTPLFLIGPFCAHHSICLNIDLWYGSFVWKWCFFNLSAFN